MPASLRITSGGRLDELAQLIRTATGAATALVTLILPDRQRFIGLAGVPSEVAATRETPLSHSFCRHVVAAEAPVVAPATRSHAALSNNPAIADLGVEAYLGVPLRGANGRVIGAVCAIEPGPRAWSRTDVETLETIADCVTRELRYAQLFDAHPQPLWVYDLQSLRILLANEAAIARYGYSAEEFLSLTIKDLRPPEDVPSLIGHLDGLTGYAKPNAWRHRLKDGTEILVEISSNDVEVDGRPARLVMAHDVTARVEAEDALKQAYRRYELVTAASSDGFFEYDAASGSFPFDTGTENLLGFKLTELEGGVEGWRERIHPDDLPHLRQLDETVGDTQGRIETTYRLLDAKGSYRWVRSRWQHVPGPDVESAHRFGSISDVTELVEARDAAQSASRLKSEFLANVSHELRTPLNGVMGMAQLLELEERDPQRRAYIRAIVDSGKALLAQIEQILDLSQIEAGALPLHPQPVDPIAIAIEALNTVRAEARGKGLDLMLVADGAPRFCRHDPGRLRQLLINLLSNAVKFTATGSVTLMIAAVGETRMQIRVEDTGIGIPEHARTLIFERFQQGDGSISRRYGGMGLGLSIAKRIVEAMNGEIGCVSGPDGTTFTVDCPTMLEGAELPARWSA